MSVSQTASDKSLMKVNVHRLSTLWKIERTDETILRFTDHNSPITFEGFAYTPAGGFDATAKEYRPGLEPSNLEITGILSSSYIKYDDLRAGRYRDAKLTEYMVDWMYPWNGALVTNVYWISELVYSGERWEARLEGLGRWLQPNKGALYSRPCRYVLGNSRCTVDITNAAYNEAGTVSSIVTARQKFLVTGLTKAVDFFNDGKLVWLTGNNVGIISEVKDYILSPNTVELHLPSPFDVQGGDTFTIYAGCDKLASTCGSKFTNLDNFGGFPYMPGVDKSLQTPLLK